MTCTWTPDPLGLPSNWETDAYLTEDHRERALMLATSSLLTLTYNRVGTCPITIRPTSARHGCGWNPQIRDGQWYNADPATGTRSEYEIPGPVGYIEEVKIDGVPVDLDNGDWRLDNGYILVWQGDGESPLPLDQDLSKPDTEPGTWSITYSRSHAVAQDGRLAVAMLAVQFLEAMKPKGRCSLPKGVRDVTRQGVSFTIEAGLFPGGLTGIEIVDQFILKWAPAESPTRTAVVFDPSVMRPRVTGGIPMVRP